MKRTTIFVPESLERELQLCAVREQASTASVVRKALAEYVARRRAANSLPSFAGAFASGYSGTAERHEQLLFKRRGSDRSASAPRSSSRRAKTPRTRRRR